MEESMIQNKTFEQDTTSRKASTFFSVASTGCDTPRPRFDRFTVS